MSSEPSQSPVKAKATVDDIVQELRWLNENFGQFTKTFYSRIEAEDKYEAETRRYRHWEMVAQTIVCIVVFCIAAGQQPATDASAIIAFFAAVGFWKGIASRPSRF